MALQSKRLHVKSKNGTRSTCVGFITHDFELIKQEIRCFMSFQLFIACRSISDLPYWKVFSRLEVFYKKTERGSNGEWAGHHFDISYLSGSRGNS